MAPLLDLQQNNGMQVDSVNQQKSNYVSLYEEDEFDNDLDDGNVMTKYRLAADIANAAMKKVLSMVAVGTRVCDLCVSGDQYILDECDKVFRKNNIEKGIAFPTCVSLNSVCSNYSPSPEQDSSLLAPGDMAKIELGVHIDGYISTCAFTTIVNPSPEAPITGSSADVVAAGYLASEICARLVRPGMLSSDLTNAICKVANAFHVKPMLETFSWEMRRFLLEAHKRIPSFYNSVAERADSVELITSRDAHSSSSMIDKPFAFEEGQVYQINIMLTTNLADQRPKELLNTSSHKVYERAVRPCVVQRNVSVNYNCKLKSSRALLSEIDKRFGVFPFAVSSLQHKNPILSELLNHGLLEVLPVETSSHPADKVAHFKFTIMCLKHPLRVTSKFSDFLPSIQSAYNLSDCPELDGLLKRFDVRTVQ